MKRFFLSFVLLLFVAACGSLAIKAPISYGLQPEVKEIALVAHYLTPLEQPESPIADASTFNQKTDALAGELQKLQARKAGQFRSVLADKMAQHFRTPVRSGSALAEAPRYERVKRNHETENLRLPIKSRFKEIYVGEDDLNVLAFRDGAVREYLAESPRMRSEARSLTRDLGVNAVAFGLSRLVIDKPIKFGASANARLIAEVFVFNDNGEMIGQGYGETERLDLSGDQLDQYRAVLDQYPALIDKVLAEMAKYELEEEEE